MDKKANELVLLIRPPQSFTYGIWPRGPRLGIPVGLLSIASYLKYKGHDVEIYDAFVEGGSFSANDEVQLPLEGQDKVRHGGLGHFGARWDEVRDMLQVKKPRIIGITNLFRENESETIECVRLAKEVCPDAMIVVGGPNATVSSDVLFSADVPPDFVVAGDGEYPLEELIACSHGVKNPETVNGVFFVRDGKIIEGGRPALESNLDNFGPLDFSLLKLDRYFQYEKKGIMSRSKYVYSGAERAVSLVTSRGCPYRCSFCSIHLHAGRKYRAYSEEYIVATIIDLVRNRGVKHIHFEDDNLTLDKERFRRIFTQLSSKGVRFTWDTPNGVHVNTLDRELIEDMKKWGCTYLVLGVESGVQRVLDEVIDKKPLNLQKVLSVFLFAKDVGLDIHAFYVVGFPREQLDEVRQTLNFAFLSLLRYNVIPHVAIARADPGTPLFDEAVHKGMLVVDTVVDNQKGCHADMFVRHRIHTSEFTPEYLESIVSHFERKVMITVLLKTMLFLTFHPYRSFKKISQSNFFEDARSSSFYEAGIKLFFTGLFYRNAILRGL